LLKNRLSTLTSFYEHLHLSTQNEEFKNAKYKFSTWLVAHIREIVHSSMLTEQEKEWMKEYVPQYTTGVSYDNKGRYVERIVMPNFFDIHRSYHD
jgi:hypothetical protein